jgi:hypothetical protein
MSLISPAREALGKVQEFSSAVRHGTVLTRAL